LEAWQRSGLSARTDVKLILCGRVYAQIKSVIAQYSFKNVAYTGFTAVAPLYAQASVFVLPSLIEGSAKAVYEAMSYGLPCIVTPNTGSIIKNGEDGIVVPSADSSTLGNAMKLLADSADARERLGREARHIVANYSWEHYAKKVVQSYEL
jgi:glycosyltransferase involved in cell wall biosynthesis